MGKFSAGGGGLPSRENSVSGVFIVNSGQISYSASIVDLEQVNACWVDYCPMAKYFWKVSNDDKVLMTSLFNDIIVDLKLVFTRWVYFHHHKIKLVPLS